MALKKTTGPGFTATARLTSITLNGIATGFRNASLYINEESDLKHWHVDMTDVPPTFSAGTLEHPGR